MLKTVKFGGSSVAGAEQFKKVKAIVEADPSRRIVVSSAAGKRSSADHKLTDLLYLCHAHLTYGVSCDEILDGIEQRFSEIREELNISYDVVAEFRAMRAKLTKDTGVDELVSRGEYFTSKLLADYIGYSFVDAKDCVFFGFDGQVEAERSYASIKKALDEHEKIVLPGFYGLSPTGKIKVMSRGGSDITGALAAAATDSDVYENWTDVSGILMADPKIVKDPKPIPRITYGELRELAFMGASVLHEESVEPVKVKGIALNIRNTNAPDDPGTMIVDKVEDEPGEEERFITGIAGRRNFSIITVFKHNMNTCAILRRTLEIFEMYKASVEHITLGLDSFALVSSTASLGDSIYDIINEIQKSCRPDDVQINDGIALVAAVGRKMPFRPGVSGKIFKALGDNGINIRTIAQGADETSIIVGVENKDFESAIQVLYDGFAG
jgi:aspartate kinase